MTIALGIMAREGIVIAADSEVSTDMTRISGMKVFCFDDSKGGRIIVTGSGNTHYLQSAAYSIGKIFTEHPDDPLIELEPTMQAFLETFYENHVTPFSTTPDPPDIALIIGASRGSESKGWISQNNILNQWRVTHAAVGIGEIHARAVLGTLAHACDFESAKIMAAYVVWLVKQRIAYCGKDTHIECFGNDGPSSLTLGQIQALENIFSNIKYLESSLWAYVFGSKSAPADQSFVYKFIEDLKRECTAAISSK